jgi:hypothetical protein
MKQVDHIIVVNLSLNSSSFVPIESQKPNQILGFFVTLESSVLLLLLKKILLIQSTAVSGIYRGLKISECSL